MAEMALSNLRWLTDHLINFAESIKLKFFERSVAFASLEKFRFIECLP
jgi:hypothetical protein